MSARRPGFDNRDVPIPTEQIARQVEVFLESAPDAVLVEGGEVLFRLGDAKYELRPERMHCVLQVWSEERNIVRRIVASEIRNDHLRLTVQRFGQSKPSVMELVSRDERRNASSKKLSRAAYKTMLRRALDRQFPGWTIERLSYAEDLEHSFGPVHVRGLMHRGTTCVAVVGVSANEPQASVDAALTTGILWLQHERERLADKRHVDGLRIVAPARRSDVIRVRMSNLNREMALWELFELDQQSEMLEPRAVGDAGNIETRLVRLPDEARARERFRESIARVCAVEPRAEIVVRSAAEVSFQICGLEFARVRVSQESGIRFGERLTFGAGENETPLNADTEPMLREAVARLHAGRAGVRPKQAPLEQDQDEWRETERLYRMQPEKWLESVIRRDATVLDDRIDTRWVYSQVPAFAAGDRGVIDLLTVTLDGRLVVVELKAQEDLHLPLQGLDYWARVRWHHERREFQKFGYFTGCQLSDKPPILLLVSPALHLHPATDTLLRHLSPEIEWKVLGISEQWRWGVRVMFRKSGEAGKVVTRG